ncbi:MAG: DinB family protein [Candidatus Promineofilum sp.]|nr:DinB family protein [Promineifilum sp.]
MINPPPVPELLAELAAFRDYVALVPAYGDDDWSRRPSADEWSLTEIACHLRDVEREVHQSRYHALLNQDGAFLPGVDADLWAIPRNYRDQSGPLALADFLAARDKTIALLAPHSAEVWARQGQHTFFGPTSLQELVYLAVQHDRVHGQQIEALVRPQSG